MRDDDLKKRVRQEYVMCGPCVIHTGGAEISVNVIGHDNPSPASDLILELLLIPSSSNPFWGIFSASWSEYMQLEHSPSTHPTHHSC